MVRSSPTLDNDLLTLWCEADTLSPSLIRQIIEELQTLRTVPKASWVNHYTPPSWWDDGV